MSYNNNNNNNNILKAGFWFLVEDFLEDYVFCMMKYLSFHNNNNKSSSFALRYSFFKNVNGKGYIQCDTHPAPVMNDMGWH